MTRFVARSILTLTGTFAAASVSAVTIVGDGGSLLAAINAAADGDVIEIHSNREFFSIGWSDKFLTVRAGPGFRPSVSLYGIVAGDERSGGRFEGLLFKNAEIRVVGSADVSFVSNTFQQLNTKDGSDTIEARGQVSFFQNDIIGKATFTAIRAFNLHLEGNRFRRRTDVTTVADAKLVVHASQNHFAALYMTPSDAVANVTVVNNIMSPQGAPRSAGFFIKAFGHSEVDVRLLNNTIVGFDTGIYLEAAAAIIRAHSENMMLQNQDDLYVRATVATIANSLISDGTFDGVNGNFAGQAMLGPQFQLLPGSIGIDAGNNSAGGLPAYDFFGGSRILDGDGDGVARVDVGAIEMPVPEPSAFALTLAAIAVLAGSSYFNRARPGTGIVFAAA